MVNSVKPIIPRSPVEIWARHAGGLVGYREVLR